MGTCSRFRRSRRQRRAARVRHPLLVLTVQHQSAEAYARSLGPTQQAEWAKIGERFRALPFFPSDRERLDVIGRALDLDQPVRSLPGLGNLARICVARGLTPTGMGDGFPALAQASYPLHPVTLLALPALFRRAGQSHRSVFNFLAGEELNALGRFLQETPWIPRVPPLYGLDRLYDYATEALSGAWSGPAASQWAEVSEAVERAEGLSRDGASSAEMRRTAGAYQIAASAGVAAGAGTGIDKQPGGPARRRGATGGTGAPATNRA